MRKETLLDDKLNVSIWLVNFWRKPLGISLYDTISARTTYKNLFRDMLIYKEDEDV